MHELSLAEGLVRLAVSEAEKAQATRVLEIRVSVGALSHVDREALVFAYEALRDGTVLEGAPLVVEQVPGRAYCMLCAELYEVEERPMGCPGCGGQHLLLSGGDDLRLRDLDMET